MKLYLFLFFNLLFLQQGLAQQPQGSKDVLQLSYGPAAQHKLDLFLPETHNDKTPVIILLHGGAWMMGSNEYTDKTAKDLRDRGFVVANVDYRYVSENISGKDLLRDIDLALSFLQGQSKTYRFGAAKFNLIGVSAGAHLALWYGYTSKKNIRSIGALCPPIRFDSEEAIAHLKQKGLTKNVELLAQAKYSTQGKPDGRFTQISPAAHLKAIPTLLFHGDRDDLVPDENSKYLFTRLQQQQIKSKFVSMKGKGHDCGMNDADSEKLVLNELTQWVLKYN